MAQLTNPMPDGGNRRKITSGTLTGGIRTDIDPTEVDLKDFIDVQGYVSTPKGLLKTPPFVSQSAAWTAATPFKVWPGRITANSATSIALVDQGATTGTTSVDSTSSAITAQPQSGQSSTNTFVITMTSTTTANLTTTTITISGTAYQVGLIISFGLAVGDILTRPSDGTTATISALTETTLTFTSSGFPAAGAISVYVSARKRGAYADFSPYHGTIANSDVVGALSVATNKPMGLFQANGNFFDTVPMGATTWNYAVPAAGTWYLSYIGAASVAVFKSFVFVGYTTEVAASGSTTRTAFYNRIRWSSPVNPLTDWTNTLSFIDLPSSYGAIMKLLPSQQYLMVYCRYGIFYGSLTGDPNLPLAFSPLLYRDSGIGEPDNTASGTSAFSVVSIEGLHAFVGYSNIWILSGLELTAIGGPIINYLRNLFSGGIAEVFRYGCLTYSKTLNQLFFGVTDTVFGESRLASYSLDTQSWTIMYPMVTYQGLFVVPLKDAAFSAYTDSLLLTSSTLGMTAQAFYRTVHTSTTVAATQLITGDIGGQQPGQIKEFFGLWVKIAENTFGATARTVSIKFTVALSTDHGVTFIQLPSPLYILPNKQEGYVTFKRISNHLRIKLTSTSLVAPYTLVSYTVDVKGMQATESLLTQGINSTNV